MADPRIYYPQRRDERPRPRRSPERPSGLDRTSRLAHVLRLR